MLASTDFYNNLNSLYFFHHASFIHGLWYHYKEIIEFYQLNLGQCGVLYMDCEQTSYFYRSGVDIPQSNAIEVWEGLAENGKNCLASTAFVTGEKFIEEDILALKHFYKSVLTDQENKFSSNGAVFNRSLREHLLLSERLAHLIAPVLGVDNMLLEALILIHDFGRTFSHRNGRNDVIQRSLFRRLEFSESITNLLPDDSLWTELDEENVKNCLEKMTSENDGIATAVILVDIFAKWKDKKSGILRRWEDIVPAVNARQKNQHDKDSMWPSELKRQGIVTSETGREYVGRKYSYLKDWFEQKTNIKIDDFIRKAEESLKQKPIPESWI